MQTSGRTNWKPLAVIPLILLTLVIVNCGKRYVGKTTNFNHPAWHRVKALPCTGRVSGIGPLDVNFTIERAEAPGAYLVRGQFDPSQGSAKSWARIIPEKSRFSMLVSSGGMIVDNIRFMVQGESLSRPLPFTFEFTADYEIDAVAFDYSFWMRG